ncbi:hypothetical protein B4U37_01705 [Sutcliffiella horikoshii]|uniref:Uncharacterized protein n=1 Tax=Sutcliffiella horikoshii TaxID=79883 RepID=A0ABN4Z8Z0_9BACI|nr:hypothetical protein [Sutcliffiella horikoshii]ART74840.1 hypothetical protein B4U37_01705 [Sutcliffiella horikoshii]
MNKNFIVSNVLKTNNLKMNKNREFDDYTHLKVNDSIHFYSPKINTFPLNTNINGIEFKDSHPVSRWNTRVGPKLTENQLLNILNQLKLLPHRIRKIEDGVGIIDCDILFTYKISENNIIIITTFYGRLSLNHSLKQFQSLRKYNKTNKEQVYLQIKEDVLDEQNPPAIPKFFMDFSGTITKYILEGYVVVGKKLPVFYVCCGTDHSEEVLYIDVNCNSDVKINKNILKVLFKMRYSDFVWNYLQNHYKEQVSLLERKFTNKKI